MKKYSFLVVLLVLFFSGNAEIRNDSVSGSQRTPKKNPNVIYILADDMGYGDLSCYGQKHFSTPNIDRLSKEGMQFMQNYAGTAVCAPSRSSLMTGQTTGYTPVRGNRVSAADSKPVHLPNSIVTIAEIMKKAGYVTGMFGKWGLGTVGADGDPNKMGFDEFYGYSSTGLAHRYYPTYLWHNHQKVTIEGNQSNKKEIYAPDLLQGQVLDFIEKNRDTPFFIYYPTIIPHADMAAPEKDIAQFRGKFLPEKSFRGVDPNDPNSKKRGWDSQPEGHAAFAAMITILDKQVGEILDRLKKSGLDSNTLVIFSSDNGPTLEGGADPNYFNSNGPFRGFKRDLYEGGIREPMLARWPGHIAPNSMTEHVSAFWDVLPTMAELVHVKAPKNIQGISFLPTLTGKGIQKQHDYLYWEFHELGGRQAVRKGKWKYVVYNVMKPEKRTAELFDLETDPGESNDVAAKHPAIVKELQDIMNKSRIPSPSFPFVETLK